MAFPRSLLKEPAPLERFTRLPYYRWLIVGTVCVGAFLGQLDASIAGLVLPTLEDEFRAPVASVEWVSISYLLVLAALVVPFGRLADLAGRKLLYTAGFAVFLLGSGLCALAPSLPWLIALRILQAVGAAMLQANSVAIIAVAVPRRELGRAIGVQGAAQAVGLSVGPSLGGLLISGLGWRWVFFIAVPFGLIGWVLGWLVLPRSEVRAAPTLAHASDRFDWAGTALLGPAIGVALLALTFGGQWGWASPRVAAALALALLLVAAFLVVERRSASPLIDLSLFRVRAVSLGLAAGLLAYAVLFGCLFVVPFYLERVLGNSPGQTGLLLTPVPMALGLLAPIGGVITDRIGPRAPTAGGLLLAFLALLALGLLSQPSTGVLLGLLALLGIGLGLFTPPNNSSIMGSAPPNRVGVAGGVLNMTRSVGTSLGVAATGAVLAIVLQAQTNGATTSTLDAPAAALQSAFHVALFFLATLCGVACLISLMRGGIDSRAPHTAANQVAAAEVGV